MTAFTDSASVARDTDDSSAAPLRQEEKDESSFHPDTQKQSRVPRKNTSADLRIYGFLLAEVGLVLSLTLTVVLLRVDLNVEQSFEIVQTEQVVVEMAEVEQTLQQDRPPPPPRPAPPIEVPDDVALEDEIIDIDAEIDIEAAADIPPPPPPPKNTEEVVEHEIFVIVEEMPKLIGGMQALHDLVEYPDLAIKSGMEGLVIIEFVVEKTGQVTGLRVTKSAGTILDKAALEAVEQVEFKPGLQRGRAVRVRMSLPVRFKLRDYAS